jgi:hypothetical protein
MVNSILYVCVIYFHQERELYLFESLFIEADVILVASLSTILIGVEFVLFN